MRKFTLGLVGAAAVALSGCAYGGFGNGLGVGIGYGSPYGGYGSYGYNPYYDPYFGYGSRYAYGYSPYGYGMYGSPYGGGWYNGYYYPGSGYYIYDRDRNRRRMSEAEEAFWRQRVASTLANRIRERRGETITTEGSRITTQQVVATPRTTSRSTERANRSESRERFREALRTRIQERRAERARQRDDN